MFRSNIYISFRAWLFSLLCIQYIASQNLIPDSSFEYNKVVPLNYSAINASNSWNMPSWGTSDLFCKCAKKFRKQSLVNVPYNAMGYQIAHSGTCYAGFFAFSHGQYREYLQSPLKAPLEKNKNYRVSFYLSLADYSRASINKLGVCFLTDKIVYKNGNVITNLKPVYMNIEKEVGKDTTVWHKITTLYKASGDECYLVIGSFEISSIHKTNVKAPRERRTRINQVSNRDAYYYIDDVSVFETEEEPVEPFRDVVVAEPVEILNNMPINTPIVLKNVLFESNKTQWMALSYSVLDELAAYLNRNTELILEIKGHTDNSGNKEKNDLLSEQRAKAVWDYLSSNGVDTCRMVYRAYGSSMAIASNRSTEGRRKNRRVEFVILKK